jgi:hypothetical protein
MFPQSRQLKSTRPLCMNYQPPIYQIPNHPSQQLKVVLDYIDNIKRWDFDALSKLSTSDFTQRIFPASLGLSPSTKNECIENLHTLRDSLKGGTLEVCDHGHFRLVSVS